MAMGSERVSHPSFRRRPPTLLSTDNDERIGLEDLQECFFPITAEVEMHGRLETVPFQPTSQFKKRALQEGDRYRRLINGQ
jgi:hypothetical protein